MLVVQVLIARKVGADGAGRVATAMTATGLFAVIGRYGADQLIMRRVAAARDSDRVRSEYGAAIRASLPALVVIGATLAATSGLIAEHLLGDPASAGPLRWLAFSLPAFGLVAVQGEAIKGAGAPVLGAAVQSIVGPTLSLAVLAVTWGSSSVQLAAASLAIGYVGASIAGHVSWKVLMPGPSSHGHVDVRGFWREAGPFAGTAFFSVLLMYIPILALAVLAEPDDVARYFAAERWTQIPSMMLVGINATVGPVFARSWADGRVDEVRRLLRRSSRATLPLALLVTILLVAAAPQLLGVFGSAYPEGANGLRLLGFAQGIVLATGPVTSMLVMSGGEKAQRSASIAAGVVVATLSLVLVPPFGVSGAAAAAAIAMLTNKVLVVWSARLVVRRAQGSLDHG